MTTEDEFQAALDATFEAHHIRLIFADWLEEREDPRAAGYRALGRRQLYPYDPAKGYNDKCPFWARAESGTGWMLSLPRDWFNLLDVRGTDGHLAPCWTCRTDATRRELEDAAAIAFTKLPLRSQTRYLKVSYARKSS